MVRGMTVSTTSGYAVGHNFSRQWDALLSLPAPHLVGLDALAVPRGEVLLPHRGQPRVVLAHDARLDAILFSKPKGGAEMGWGHENRPFRGVRLVIVSFPGEFLHLAGSDKSYQKSQQVTYARRGDRPFVNVVAPSIVFEAVPKTRCFLSFPRRLFPILAPLCPQAR